jgi:hypothetical protein
VEHVRHGIIGFCAAPRAEALAAVDLGGATVIDRESGRDLARFARICASSGLVRFGLQDRVLLFASRDLTLEAWDWGGGVHLGSLPLPEEPRALAACDLPIVAALLDNRVHVVNLVAGQAQDIEVDPRTTELTLSPTGEVVIDRR